MDLGPQMPRECYYSQPSTRALWVSQEVSTMTMINLDQVFARFQSQISRAETVLFTGAGFSLAACDSDLFPIPTSKQLAQEFWNIAFPTDEYSDGVKLGDTFYSAKRVDPKGLHALIQRRLSVNSEDLPASYKTWFSMPWLRCYTLNIDDVELATSIRYQLPRSLSVVSATSGKHHDSLNDEGALDVIHLNGALWDSLDDLSFSAIDYGLRGTTLDPWYRQCVADIVSRPFVFVGTDLDESPLWDYLAIRGTKGTRGLRELRPGSLLVGPSLNAARRLMLSELHIDWLQMTAEEFAAEFLERLEQDALKRGFECINLRRDSERRSKYPQLVSDLASKASGRQTEYLMGQEPEWSDLQSGRAIHRDYDDDVFTKASSVLESRDPEPPIVLTGTAGSGKSTSLMRLALRITGEGIPTYWIDERSNIEPYRVRDLIVQNEEPVVIIVDDADIFGRAANRWATELASLRGRVLFAFAVRSSKVDSVFQSPRGPNVALSEFTMSNLTDKDIGALIRVLDQENRLGVLKGRSHRNRVEAFRKRAGRQLLVAMIEATSGHRFEYKAVHEFMELTPVQKMLYATICFVHAQRFSLDRDELLTAANAHDNETLNELDKLVSRNLVIRRDTHSEYKARHRVVAERVVNSQAFRSISASVIAGVCESLATHLKPQQHRNSRNWRRFIKFINHDFILNFCSVDDGRNVYQSVEGLLEWDYHYWLQRGSLEVEKGDLAQATNYLGQARSLADYDPLVEAEWSYLQMKKASQWPRNTGARDLFMKDLRPCKG